MDYRQIAGDILANVGGADNVRDVSHCFTRLRLVLADAAKGDKDAVEKIEGVLQVVVANGQFQVVLGGKVNKVYDEFLPLVNDMAVTGEVIPVEKGSPVNTVLQLISKIFTPIVPAIAAAGLIKGLLSAASRLGWVDSSGSTYVILFAASNIIFYYMPVFLAYTAADALKCNRVIAMVLGAFLCYPQIDTLVQDVATPSTIFGLPVIKTAFTIGESTRVFSYTESVIPIVLAVIVLYFLEKFLKKYIPDMLQIILVPGLSLIIMLPVMLTVVGPVGAYIGYAMQWVYNGVMGISPFLGGAIMGIGGASNHGFANNGILTIATYICADNTMGQFIAYLIGICVAFFGAAALTYIVGFEDEPEKGKG